MCIITLTMPRLFVHYRRQVVRSYLIRDVGKSFWCTFVTVEWKEVDLPPETAFKWVIDVTHRYWRRSCEEGGAWFWWWRKAAWRMSVWCSSWQAEMGWVWFRVECRVGVYGIGLWILNASWELVHWEVRCYRQFCWQSDIATVAELVFGGRSLPMNGMFSKTLLMTAIGTNWLR